MCYGSAAFTVVPRLGELMRRRDIIAALEGRTESLFAARAAAGNAGDWISQQYVAGRHLR
jgi:hypothetical protein